MSTFSSRILSWYQENKRNLPWRRTNDAYNIWLSEVMLQQTQVSQGTPYYERFVKLWPTVFDLAAASQQDVLNEWQGLGYYSRAINLHKCAKEICEKYSGAFPKESHELQKLPGIGEYTANAIASIAFAQPAAVVDGNVFRVLARAFNVATPINTTSGKKQFSELATSELNRENPGDHNQAMMEFGARVCRPKNPDCESCVVADLCVARAENLVANRPVKLKKTKVIEVWHYYFVYVAPNSLLIQQRDEGGIWKNMFEFPVVESRSELHEVPTPVNHTEFESLSSELLEYRHLLSHRKINARFQVVHVTEQFPAKEKQQWIKKNEVENFPWPRLMDRFLSELFKTF